MHYSSLRAAIHVAAVLAVIVSLAMLVPAAADLHYRTGGWRIFVYSAFGTGGLGLAVALATYGAAAPMSVRFGFLVVNLSWVSVCVVASVPFLAAPLGMSVADAIFEAVSGVTTTGGTVIVGLDDLDPGLLLWRSLLQWIGGLGVIALGLFVLPYLQAGGISYFRIESFDITDRPFERFSTHIYSIVAIYSGLTVACAIAYAAAGMSGFEALNHALTTISTGGFSTHDASMGAYGHNSFVLWVGIVFMFVGALPFSILILLALAGRLDTLRDPQIRLFASYIAAFVVAAFLGRLLTGGAVAHETFTHTAFNVVSLLTTTGFASADYLAWGGLATSLAFAAMFVGGCSGSTSGGVKVYRHLIFFKMIANGLRRLLYPHMVQTIRYGERPVEERTQLAAVVFLCAFMLVWLVATMLLGATGVDIDTAMSGALSALTNTGPGLGETIGPAGTFAPLPDAAKWILSATMLLGRLEILAVMVIFMPVFWAR